MAFFGLRGKSSPRLTPELDDSALGRLCKQLQTPAVPGMLDFHVDAVERLVQEAEADWDRRWHRLSVLARLAAGSNFAHSWLLRNPRSADALVFSAWVDTVRVRRGGPMEELPLALQRCYRACDIRPQDPLPFVALLGVLRLMRSPAQQVEQVWREISLRDPWNREAHLQLLGYLSADEGGVPGQAAEFIEGQRARMPADAPAIGAELIVAVRDYHRATAGGDLNSILADLWWGRLRGAKVLDQATEQWTRPGFLHHAASLADLNVLAYSLAQAGRLSDAASVFEMIGPVVTAWPWAEQGRAIERFRYWRGRAVL